MVSMLDPIPGRSGTAFADGVGGEGIAVPVVAPVVDHGQSGCVVFAGVGMDGLAGIGGMGVAGFTAAGGLMSTPLLSGTD